MHIKGSLQDMISAAMAPSFLFQWVWFISDKKHSNQSQSTNTDDDHDHVYLMSKMERNERKVRPTPKGNKETSLQRQRHQSFFFALAQYILFH